MWKQLSKRLSEFRWRIHSFVLGTTVALGAAMLGQGCTGAGT
jgi:hypothetical protein